MANKYKYICAGYLVESEKVLLVFHKKFQKWTPPGGHMESDETFAETAEREFLEETGLEVAAISSASVIHPQDNNSTPIPLPFYADIMTEGFRVPTIGHYLFVKRTGDSKLRINTSEIDDARWFTSKELDTIETFEQVRSLSRYAIEHYPAVKPF